MTAPRDRMKNALVDALNATRDERTEVELCSGLYREPPEKVFLAICGGPESRVEFGAYFDANKLADRVLAAAREILRAEILEEMAQRCSTEAATYDDGARSPDHGAAIAVALRTLRRDLKEEARKAGDQ